jgi:hypothetical protein
MWSTWRVALIVRDAAVVIAVAGVGCAAFRNPMLDIPISADGATRSPPFRLYSDTTYQITIGLDPMAVDESTCAAAYAAQSVSVPSPCGEIRPPFGPIRWVLTQGGKMIAQGSLPGEPADIPRGRPNSWANDKRMTWGTYPGWFGHPGNDYVIEVNLGSGAVNLAAFHPRFAIIEPDPQRASIWFARRS